MSLRHSDTLPSLRATNLTFGFRAGQTPVLQNWSETFEGGTMTAITGASGSGKSTLLFLLGMLLRPLSGEVHVNGVEVGRLGDRDRARLRSTTLGFVFQDALLDPRRSVGDNVLLPATFRGEPYAKHEEEARRLLASFGVSVPFERKPAQVSGGQAQRIALCRALLHQPDVILADEPTGNLDQESAHLVISELTRRAREGAVVLVVTHSPEVVALCDRSITINESRSR